MQTDVQALTLTDTERHAILAYWPSPDAFLAWQRDALAAELERRKSAQEQAKASSLVADGLAAMRQDFPTVFGKQP